MWTDGPTVDQVREASREAEPEAAEGLRYERRLSQETVALGAIRMALTPATAATGVGNGSRICPSAIETLWQNVSRPSPRTDRERALVYAVIVQVHNDHRRNQAHDYEICELLGGTGLAPLLRRTSVLLSPIEILTDHYAPSHAHLAWKYRLTPMTAPDAFRAVHADPKASPELIAAALTLVPALTGTFDTAASELRARLQELKGTA
ncbi:hypothetical protein SLUN_36965 [Streptomyces lunaelactis]|uniref:Uncharacterized protein n=1 Tax=Streptomyces lunaelactis TaxID=1535768 RepID=A0A2R4TFF3_9ACTN|nr:hypothetical protein SLUN_36965 [Streptomyces lunaelactis]NUK83291.1 hypothetical protein [Streptomyces lunaelactis]